MSDYHVLDGTLDGNTFNVVLHIPVPDVPNEVGRSYRDCIMEYRPFTTSTVPLIDVLEVIDLQNGRLLEHSMLFDTHPGESLADKRTRLRALFTSEKTRLQSELSYRLSYWGYGDDVP